ncbi:hypothetical protein RvY_02211-3 [Ramazzottius varieornatus]|uniref:Uncharacterized protein n=1 Tax=Ramazzottius varieornatus TaxID=947166 RepID=A0A1D1UIY5_RAMVA|nr:hypothetical protein RvY_02211-3 [Ramazzottius varieornatus]
MSGWRRGDRCPARSRLSKPMAFSALQLRGESESCQNDVTENDGASGRSGYRLRLIVPATNAFRIFRRKFRFIFTGSQACREHGAKEVRCKEGKTQGETVGVWSNCCIPHQGSAGEMGCLCCRFARGTRNSCIATEENTASVSSQQVCAAISIHPKLRTATSDLECGEISWFDIRNRYFWELRVRSVRRTIEQGTADAANGCVC